ncbi:hypothetical protein KPJ18_25795 [Escherichia coli]|nr:hypothetical protein [Escherichia coli]
MIWQPEFTDKTLSRKPGAVQSPRSANAQAIRELSDIAGTPEAVDVLCLCLDIADQDGIGEQEEQALKKIAQALQLSLDAYL